MKNKYAKGILRTLATTLVTTLLIILIDIFTKGMYLMGIPRIDNVEKVTISYTEFSNEVKEISDKEHIELAVKLTGFLKYSLFKKADLGEPPLITITYFTYDGDVVSVSANKNTVWWKGKAHSIKDDETFINLTEGIFYFEDLIENGR